MKGFILEAGHAAQEKNHDACAQILIHAYTQNKTAVQPGEGLAYLNRLILGMLSRNLHVEVAHILWGSNLFSAEPESVRSIWKAVRTSATLLVQGGGSLGKSYSCGAYFLLDWLEDPCFTSIKVVSVTREHAQRNAFAHIKRLHQQSSIPLPGEVKANSIQASSDDSQGIHLVAIPEGEEGAGRLQGFHPKPRQVKHPKYGILTRVRAILDEAEEIPSGVWEDIDNMLITLDGIEHVKIAAAANPRDRDSKFGQRCEPVGGWGNFDLEESLSWKSKLGWDVVRLDGARCENVVAKRVIFPGFLTYEGYRRYLLMGDNTPEYFTMGRGAFPEQGLAINAIPHDFFDKGIGRLRFSGPTTYCMSIDQAFEGDDDVLLTMGRFGLASGYAKPDGLYIPFPEAKYSLQAESQSIVPKNDPSGLQTQTPWITSQIKAVAKQMAITGHWVICDRTGNGTGAHDILKSRPPDGIGEEVVGINFSSKATDLKIFRDSTEKASDVYEGIVTELFFALRAFLEFDYLKISPSVNVDRLRAEACTRRFRPGRARLTRIESKREYKARTGGNSPDAVDSLTLLVHLVRMREGFEAALLPHTGGNQRDQEMPDNVVGNLATQYMDWRS